MSRPPVRATTLAAAVSLALAAPAAAADFADTALNVIPSGQYGAVPVPPGADEQAKLCTNRPSGIQQVISFSGHRAQR